MRLTFHLLALACVFAVAGCKSKPAEFSDVPEVSRAGADNKPVVRSSNALAGKVVSFNSVGGFVVVNFPITRMPAMDQKLSVYRGGFKVGEIKITGPQREDNIVGDLTAGEAKAGDEVRDR